MSTSSRKLLQVKQAQDRFEAHKAVLLAQLEQGAPRPCLEAMVELCGLYAGATGGTLVTQALMTELKTIHARVQARPHLREVRNPMSFEIETAWSCPLCDAPGKVTVSGAGGFDCHCSGCYDGAEDAALASQTIGHGKSAREACADWCEKMEAHVPQHVGFWPASVATIARAEFKRQAGWIQTKTEHGIVYAPAEDWGDDFSVEGLLRLGSDVEAAQ